MSQIYKTITNIMGQTPITAVIHFHINLFGTINFTATAVRAP